MKVGERLCDVDEPYYAFGIFGTTLLENFAVFHSSSRKVVPISPNASYLADLAAVRRVDAPCQRRLETSHERWSHSCTALHIFDG
jgi:hypothetical protein